WRSMPSAPPTRPWRAWPTSPPLPAEAAGSSGRCWWRRGRGGGRVGCRARGWWSW
ncbi:unnamed protein product, partial [Effrenium voratum]